MGGFSNFAISFSDHQHPDRRGHPLQLRAGAGRAPGAVGIGWPLVTVFTLLIAASMAEIASAYPTAGGLYYWASRLPQQELGLVDRLAQPRAARSRSSPASTTPRRFYIGATILGPLFGFRPATPRPAGLTERRSGSTGLLMLIEIGFNVAGTKIVATMNDISVWWHIGLVVAIGGRAVRPRVAARCTGRLPVHRSQPVGRRRQWHLGEVTSSRSGSRGAFALSLLLQSQWTYTGYDASAHVAEETVQARTASRVGRLPVGRGVRDLRLHRPGRTLTPKDRPIPPTSSRTATGGGGVAYILEAQPRRRTRPARRSPGCRDRHRDDVLRLLLDRLRRSDAVRVQPR